VGGATAIQLLDDGTAAEVDANTQAVTRVAAPKDLTPDLAGRWRPKTPADDTTCNHASLRTRSALVRAKDAGRRWRVEDLTAPRSRLVLDRQHSERDYLQPLVIDGELPLLAYRASLQRDAATQLARLRPDGSQAWSVDLRGPCEQLRQLGDVIVVTTTASNPRALAIDVETGAVRWTSGT
jgi:hypothetical protein